MVRVDYTDCGSGYQSDFGSLFSVDRVDMADGVSWFVKHIVNRVDCVHWKTANRKLKTKLPINHQRPGIRCARCAQHNLIYTIGEMPSIDI